MIKVDAYGDSAKSSISYFEYHVNTQFNKIPQLVMELQRERDGGMIPQGIGWGVSQPLRLRRSQMSVGGPCTLSYLFFLYPQSSISSRSWLTQLMPWAEQGMAV